MFSNNAKKIIKKHIPIIAEITGLSAGTLLAIFFEMKDGSMIAGNLIHPALADFLNRMLSPKQEQRILTASALAANYIQESLDRGEELRNDRFFSEGTVARSDAVEVVDSMLFTVGNEEQEKKIPYMARLIENAAFDESISADSACYYLQIFRNLTYRQICMIKIIVEKDRFQLTDKSKISMLEMKGPKVRPKNMEQFFEKYEEDVIFHEFLDLHIKGYITLQMSHNTFTVFNDFALIPRTAMTGKLIFNVYHHMNLGTIPDDDLAPIVKALS